MKKILAVLLALGLLMGLSANAWAVARVQIDFDGTQNLTQLGWLTNGQADVADLSVGVMDGGVGVLQINDNTGSFRQKMYLDIPGMSASQGIVMARVKFISSSGSNTNGTFGISGGWGDVDAGASLCIRNNQLNWKTADGGNQGPDPLTLSTSDYRVYAIEYGAAGWRAWYTTTTDWSSNSADWVDATGFQAFGAAGALRSGTGAKLSGLVLGDICSASAMWTGNIDWIQYSTYSDDLNPWAFSPNPVPEPGSMLALATGLVGFVGIIRRKRS